MTDYTGPVQPTDPPEPNEQSGLYEAPEVDEPSELNDMLDAMLDVAEPATATEAGAAAVTDGVTGATGSGSGDADSADGADDSHVVTKKRRRRFLPRSRRGILILALFLGAFGVMAGVGGMMLVHYTESSSFCSSCHAMSPEQKAYAASVHREVPCSECHVEPGVGGFVKAKIKGMKQLFEVVTGNVPKPIEPPDHSELPPVKDSCLKCHSLKDITESGGPVKLVLRLTYRPDEKNTREQVAVVLRPAGIGQQDDASLSQTRGVHWHVQLKVTYATADASSKKIDLVDVAMPDGSTRTYVAGSAVATSSQVTNDVARIEKGEKNRVMDCLDCHNRVGHEAPSVDRAVDDAVAEGKISADLPYIKRDAVGVLNGDYKSLDEADAAIDALGARFAANYPLVVKSKGAQLDSSIAELKLVYRLVATPDMKVMATTYADNLGHQASAGCFRCHDGAHYLVEKGKLTDKTIPSGCATCHTFPQVGPKVAGVLIGGEPTSHNSKLFAFDHAKLAKTTNPAGTSCGTCHVQTYCQNCHSSGAINVKHDTMLYSHGVSARTAGVQACNYCHQPASCVKCHKNPLPDGGGNGGGGGAVPSGRVTALKPP